MSTSLTFESRHRTLGRSKSLFSATYRRLAGAVLAGAALALAAAGCNDSDSLTGPDKDAVFLVRACKDSLHAPGGEHFRVLIRDPRVAAQAEALIGAGNVIILGGELRLGNGSFNQPWSWRLDPETVRVTDGAIGICDGCPSFVESNLDYWVGNVGTFCPTSTEVLARER